jgi:uncharacterized phage protein gp47/JayE
MPSIQLETEETILERMTLAVVARTDFSDLVDTSEFRELLAAVARNLDNVYLQLALFKLLFDMTQARGDNLDLRVGDIAPKSAGLRRQGARPASGRLVLSRGAVDASRLVYAAGVVGLTDDGLEFRTTEQAVIESGQTDSNAVTGVAIVPGSSGNVDVGAIRKFRSKPPGLSAITNTTKFARGRDRESDDEYLARALAYLAAQVRATPRALLGATFGVEDAASGKQVRFQRLIEPIRRPGTGVLYIDDGAGTARETTDYIDEVVLAAALGGEEYVRLPHRPVDMSQTFEINRVRATVTTALTRGTDYDFDPPSGLMRFDPPLQEDDQILGTWSGFDGLTEEVQRVVDGDDADETNYPGYRAAGVSIQVLPASVIVLQVSYVLSYAENVTDVEAVNDAVRSAILTYVNNLGLESSTRNAQSRTLVVEHLDAVVKFVPGVFDIQRVAPVENRVPAEDEVIRITAANIDLL